MRKLYDTGRGSVRVRAVYTYDKESNCIDITEIPPTTTVEAIIAKLADLVKAGKIREISDVRNEIGLDGLKITIDLKRGTDPDRLMARLFAMTPLEDSFSCNFNILIAGAPQVLGVRRILEDVYKRQELHSLNPAYAVRRFEGPDVMQVAVLGLVMESKRKFI